jgi:branched-chain amino acid transport system ATP-binding protein
MPRRHGGREGDESAVVVQRSVDVVENVQENFAEGAVGEALALLEQVDLADFAQTQTVELPYGRKRALEIATTLALDPELMLLDEPTQGMGHEDVGRVVELIGRVAAKRTVLMVEHNMNVVSDLSDTITVLARGSVLAEGPYETVSKDPRVLEAYVGTVEETAP